MTSLTSPSAPCAASSLILRRPLQSQISTLGALDFSRRKKERKRPFQQCRAELSQDAPFALAMGRCVLNSMIFPIPSRPDDTDSSGSAIDSTDTRFAVMGIVSFIPYFNWLSWLFAWLDTSSRRYLVYSIVYLAPYLRTNLSLSPEESWLPIGSIIICIFHIQLEASIRSGDIKTIELLGEILKSLSPGTRKQEAHSRGQQVISEKVVSTNKNQAFHVRKNHMIELEFELVRHDYPPLVGWVIWQMDNLSKSPTLDDPLPFHLLSFFHLT